MLQESVQQQQKEQEPHHGPRPPQHVLRKVNRKVQFLESEWMAWTQQQAL
jgi:hypothetical protein